MWQRFTEAARRSVFLAQEEAKQRGQKYVSTEHLLLGLIREDGAIAMRILMRLEISPNRVQEEIEKSIKSDPLLPDPDMQLTPRAKLVLDKAFAEARQLQHSYIGTEHILLGLIVERNGLGGQVLNALGADIEKARRIACQLTAEASAGEPAIDSPERGADGDAVDARTAALPVEVGDTVTRWERFVAPARRACILAQEEACGLGHAEVEPEHFLLALIGDPQSKASLVLYTLEIPTEPVRREILARLTPGAPVDGADARLTARTKRLLDRAFEEARDAQHEQIDTQHLLVALIDEGEGIAFEVLSASSVYIFSARRLSQILDRAPSSNTAG